MSSSVPPWLEKLLLERFFNPCPDHETAKKNERNVYCLDCCFALCPHCLPSHRPHRLLQIRRYVYHDVVRVENLEKLMNCNFIQTYTTNSAKVLFLNERAQGRPCRGLTATICSICDRAIHRPNLFCCLSCKVKQVVASEGGVAKHLRRCESLPPPSSGEIDDAQLSPDSVLDSHSSTSSADAERAVITTVTNDPPPMLLKKKRSSVGSARRPAARSHSSEVQDRRKGVPRRAPFF